MEGGKEISHCLVASWEIWSERICSDKNVGFIHTAGADDNYVMLKSIARNQSPQIKMVDEVVISLARQNSYMLAVNLS